MQSTPEIIELLNDVLTAELTAINQYFIHYKMQENWGYQRLASKGKEESFGEMKHAEELMERLLFLDATPKMEYLPLSVGGNVREQLEADLKLEIKAVKMYNDAIAVSRDEGDTFSAPQPVPQSADARGWNGSSQGLLMKKLAVSARGELVIANSSLRPNESSRVWLMRARNSGSGP
jgi:bacterioferritin